MNSISTDSGTEPWTTMMSQSCEEVGMSMAETEDSDEESAALLARLKRLRGLNEGEGVIGEEEQPSSEKDHQSLDELVRNNAGDDSEEDLDNLVKTNTEEDSVSSGGSGDHRAVGGGTIICDVEQFEENSSRQEKDAQVTKAVKTAEDTKTSSNKEQGMEEIEMIGSQGDSKPKLKKKRSLLKRRISWKESCEIYTWDTSSHGPNISIVEGEPHILRREVAKQSTDGARGVHGVRTGRCLFKFQFNDKPWGSHCAVGVCTKRASLHCQGYSHLLGQNAESWGWDIPSKKLLHQGETLRKLGESLSRVPLDVYLLLDMDQGTVALSLGDMRQFKTVFTGLNQQDHKLYPAVSLVYGGSEVAISVVPLHHLDDIAATETVAMTHHSSDDHESFSKAPEKEAEEDGPESRSETANQFQPSRPRPSSPVRRVSKLDTVVEQSEEMATTTTDDLETASNSDKVIAGDAESRNAQDVSDEVEVAPKTEESLQEKSENEREDPDLSVQEDPKAVDPDSAGKDSTKTESSWEPSRQDSEEKPWRNELLIRYNSMTTKKDEDEEEESDSEIEHMQILELSETDQYLVQVAHGWDSTNKGAQLQVYPNSPNLCTPSARFANKVQAIKTRRGFKRGCHRWLIQEHKFYTQCVEDENFETTSNDLIIGAVDNEHRTFNYGFSIAQLGRHAWGFQPRTKMTWHKADKEPLQPDPEGLFKTEEDLQRIDLDLTQGVEMTLDTKAHTLTLTYQGQRVHTFSQLRAREVFPFVLFHQSAMFPVEIKYIEGPKAHIEKTLEYTARLPKYQLQDFFNYRPLLHQQFSRHNSSMVEATEESCYEWGKHSAGIGIQGTNTIYMSKPPPDVSSEHDVAIAGRALSGSRHSVRFTTEHPEQFVLALVSDDFDSSIVTPTSHVRSHKMSSILGRGVHSWAWDLRTLQLHHGNTCLGRYPIYKDFDPRSVQHYTMILDFNSYTTNSVAFSVQHTDGSTRDLGLAFINLPSKVWPAAAIVYGEPQGKLTMSYMAGPPEFVEEIKTSSVCTIL